MRNISVVVPAYNPQAGHVERCLDALLGQQYPPHLYEVILIDDGSDNRAINDCLDALASDQRTRIRYHKTSHSGVALARQRGLELARGELVAFTDIDCVAAPLWLKALDQGLRSSSLGGIGGHVLSYSRRTYIERYCDYYGSLRTPVFRDGHVIFLIGANSCWRSEVLDEIGGLNAEYGRHAGSGVIVGGYEDFELSLRVRSRGYQLGYSPSAIVYHQHRSTLRARLRQFYHYGGGGAFFHHMYKNLELRLGRYDLDYPPCSGRILRSILREALLLPIKPLDARNRNLSLDRRIAYPLFDFLQRISFSMGFCSMSRRLVALGQAEGGTGLPPEIDHPYLDAVHRLPVRENDRLRPPCRGVCRGGAAFDPDDALLQPLPEGREGL